MDDVVKNCKKHGNLTKDLIYFRRKRPPECKLCTLGRQKKYYKWKFPDRKYKKELPDGIVKDCKHHGYLKKEETFFHISTYSTGGHSVCKYCKNEYYRKNEEKIKKRASENAKKDRKLYPEKFKIRGQKYQRKFRDLITKKMITRRLNFSLVKYEQMFVDQDNKCYICNKEETKISHHSGKIARLSLDHCHKTMKVRRLLCHNCNIMMGASKESIETLLRAVDYLKEFQ